MYLRVLSHTRLFRKHIYSKTYHYRILRVCALPREFFFWCTLEEITLDMNKNLVVFAINCSLYKQSYISCNINIVVSQNIWNFEFNILNSDKRFFLSLLLKTNDKIIILNRSVTFALIVISWVIDRGMWIAFLYLCYSSITSVTQK